MTEGLENHPVPGPASPDEAVAVAGGHGSFVVPGDLERRLKELGTSALLWILSAVMASPEPHQYGLAWVTLPIVVVIALHFGRRALDPSPRLVVDSEGITDRTSIFGGTLYLRWEEIRAVAPARWKDAVDLEIMDMDAVRARLGLGRRIEIALNRFFGFKRLSIALTLLGTTKGE